MAEQTLVQLCFHRVVQHMNVLQNRLSDLPASLLKDLLPHLNIFYLDRLEEIARQKGISTASVWASKWKDLDVSWRYKLKFKQLTGEDCKQKYLESYFHMWLFRKLRSSQLNLADHADLTLSAKHVRVLTLFRARDMHRLVSEDMRPILSTLEKGVTTVSLLDAKLMVECKKADLFFILHRLLDHGSVKELHMKMPDFSVLSWITSRCTGPSCVRAPPDEGPAASKRPRLDAIADETVPGNFSPSCSVNGTCPKGEIHSLNLEVWSLADVTRLVPSWLSLRSFHLYVYSLLWEQEADDLVDSFRKLFLQPHCSLRDLSLGNVCVRAHLASLLTSCLTLQNLTLEINLPRDSSSSRSRAFHPNPQVFLEKLSLKTVDIPMKIDFPSVIQLAPKLSSLHVAGIQHARSLLHTLPESSPLLKVLRIEDANLSDCHQEIIHLLHNSSLQELWLKDCRLLERCSVKTDFLLPFVEAVKRLSSLHFLSLAQNRLATSVAEMADLFLGDHSSNITKLDLSSNFILPADLLEFSQRIEVYRPAQRFTLNLCFNPLDRDPEMKDQALRKLFHFCDILTDDWDSRSMMADHVSVM